MQAMCPTPQALNKSNGIWDLKGRLRAIQGADFGPRSKLASILVSKGVSLVILRRARSVLAGAREIFLGHPLLRVVFHKSTLLHFLIGAIVSICFCTHRILL